MKKFNYIIFTFIVFIGFSMGASAANSSLSVSSSSVVVGSSFTASANLSGVAAWNVRISASGPVSGCSTSAADSSANAENVSKTISVTCKATGTGNITVSLSGDVTSADGINSNVSGMRTVSVSNANSNNSNNNNPSTYKSNSSRNNSKSNSSTQSANTANTAENVKQEENTDVSLKSLSIDGYNLTPTFDSAVTEYSLLLNSDVSKINIIAEASKGDAIITGAGEKEVKTGENKFEIVVTSNNVSKTYILTVTVDEKPLTVKVNGKSYNIIKDKEKMPELLIEHEDLTLTINDTEVPAYRIDKINYVLLALQDSKGNIKLFRFQSFKNDNKKFIYTPFIYFENGKNIIVYLEMPKSKVPDNYKKYKIKINDENIEAYKKQKDSKYALIYGINIQDGKKNVYKYEQTEQTFQIYDKNEIMALEDTVTTFEIIIFMFIIVAFVIVLIKFIQIISYRKKRKSKINVVK